MNYLRATFRFVLFFTCTIGLYTCWFLGNLAIPNKQYWRQIIFRTWAKWFVSIANLDIEVIGEKPAAPFFLVSNHLGYVDIPVLRSVIESVFVAKGEIEGWFFAGRLVTDMGNIFINRQNRRDIPRAGAKVIEKLDGGEGVIIFPEGTSSKGEEVLPFNSSFFEFAAQTNLPIHYASITYRIESDSLKASEMICWWDDTSFIVHLWRFFGVKRSRAIVSFGCESVVSDNRKELARELWTRVSDKFIPTS